MPFVLGVDIGTTTITTLALDAVAGDILAIRTAANRAQSTAPADKARGYSEWDMQRIAYIACACLREVTDQLAARKRDLVGLGITGQQHGVVLVDNQLAALTPLINWQDRRAEQVMPGSTQTYVSRAAELLGEGAPPRTGCRVATGYQAVTLFWMKQMGLLPATGTACFVMDYFASLLTGQPPVTDASCAASGGVLDLRSGTWADDLIARLNLPRSLFPPVRMSGDQLGTLSTAMAEATGLIAGLPVFVGIGDNQASFLGSVANRNDTALCNVGTGGQVAAYSDEFIYDPKLETRPFPRGGFLVVDAGLSGGRSYAVLEQFFRDVLFQFAGMSERSLYPVMNQLAEMTPGGADGLRFEPLFSGTRANPEVRASLSGVSAENFTPGNMIRGLLEGMARGFRRGFEAITSNVKRPLKNLVGAGNGLRENPLLARLIGAEFGMPLRFAMHREEAAYGAALLAAVGARVIPDLPSAGQLIRMSPASPSR